MFMLIGVKYWTLFNSQHGWEIRSRDMNYKSVVNALFEKGFLVRNGKNMTDRQRIDGQIKTVFHIKGGILL